MAQPPKTDKSAPHPARVVQPIKSDAMAPFELKAVQWVVYAPDTLEIEDLENPTVWVLATKIRRGDRVSVMQSRRFVDMVCADNGPGFAVMKTITAVDLPPRREGTSTALPPGFEVRRAEPEDRAIGTWVAVRLSDGHIFNRDQPHYSFESARQYLLSHASVRASDNAKLWHEV